MRRKEKRSYGKGPKRNWMNGIAIMRSKLLRQKQQIEMLKSSLWLNQMK